MGLLNSSSEDPQSKLRRYVILGLLAAIALVVLGLYITRYNAEKRIVRQFFDTLVKGEAEAAYRLWQPKPTYTYKDFLDDWGRNGFYGPVKSYHIVTTQRQGGASGVVVVVEVSPFEPFPSDTEREKLQKNKEVKLWVERETQALAFAP